MLASMGASAVRADHFSVAVSHQLPPIKTDATVVVTWWRSRRSRRWSCIIQDRKTASAIQSLKESDGFGICSGDEDGKRAPRNSGVGLDGPEETLSRIRDSLRIFFAVMFWMSLFFWASVWDGKDGPGPKRGSRFRS